MGNCKEARGMKSDEQEDEIELTQKDSGICVSVKIGSKKGSELFNYAAKNQKQLTYDLLQIQTLPKQLQHLFRRSEEDGFMVFNAGAAGARAHASQGNNNNNNNNNNNSRHRHHDITNSSNINTNQAVNFQDKEERGGLRKWVNISSLEKDQGIEIHVNDLYKLGNTFLRVKGIFFSERKKRRSMSGNEDQTLMTTKAYSRISTTEKRKGSLKGANLNKAATTMLSSKCLGTEDGQDEIEGSNNLSEADPGLMSHCATEGHPQQQQSSTLGGKVFSKKVLENTKQCRICLESEFEQANFDHLHSEDGSFNNEDEDNPLLSVCNCSGSLKYVHLQCLQTWVRSKQGLNEAFKSKYCQFYGDQAMHCELCKKEYPLKIALSTHTLFLLSRTSNQMKQAVQQGNNSEENHNNNNNNILPTRSNLNNHNNSGQSHSVDQSQQAQPVQPQNQSRNREALHINILNIEDEVDENQNNQQQPQNGNNDDSRSSLDSSNSSDDYNQSSDSQYSQSMESYVIMEITNSSSLGLNGVVIIDLSATGHDPKTVYSLGRQNECDIKFNDITVSRQHAQLIVDREKSKVFIKDCQSKFGTLIQLRRELVVNTRLSGLQVQINNVCLEFDVRQNPQEQFRRKAYLLSKSLDRENSRRASTFSFCQQAVNKSTSYPQEIRISDTSINVLRDRDYHPQNQLHDG